MPKDRLHLDYETYCEADLTQVGNARYSEDPTMEILMASWAINDQEIEQWVPAEGEPIPPLLEEALFDPEVVKWAWNAPFEISITNNAIGECDLTQWRCTQVLAMTCSLPGKLDKAGPIVDLPDHMLKQSGTRLINKFSKPRKPTKRNPATRLHWNDDFTDWLEYKDYNVHDTLAERGIWHRLKHFMPPDEEWELWVIDQIINRRGIPINMKMVRNALAIAEYINEDRFKKMQEITGLDNPNSTQQLLPWMQANGYIFDDCQKAHIKTSSDYFKEPPEYWDEEKRIEYQAETDLQQVLEYRQEVARTSITKYQALDRATSDDGNLKHAFQFAGAQRTWRWAGRIFQPQNLPRPEKRLEKGIIIHAKNVEELNAECFEIVYDRPMDVLASTIRPAAQAPDGYLFIDADLNAIENRVLGWLSSCAKILRVFELNRDPYVDFATYLFGGNYDDLMAEYKSGDGFKRQISKPGVLGCGYMLGAGKQFRNHSTGEMEGTGLLGYAWNMGITEFTPEQSALSVETFRREFEEVTDYWYGIERAAKKCINTGKRVEFGHVAFDKKGPFMRMILPSGRCLHYCRPRIEDVMMPWGDMKASITYEGLNDKKQWQRLNTHPGKLTENADQAIARDLLAHGMKLAMREGLDVRIHVHDQLVALSEEDRAEDELEILRQCMMDQPKWAKGLPLGCGGFISKMFIKD